MSFDANILYTASQLGEAMAEEEGLRGLLDVEGRSKKEEDRGLLQDEISDAHMDLFSMDRLAVGLHTWEFQSAPVCRGSTIPFTNRTIAIPIIILILCDSSAPRGGGKGKSSAATRE